MLAVVTGAAQGIGRSVAEAFAADGYDLALLDLREPVETLVPLRARGAEALAISCDVSADDAVATAADRVRERFGRVDVLVNNAGVSLIAPAEETTPEQWRRVLEVNLTGPFLLCRAFGRMMLEAGAGSIVNVASIAGLGGVRVSAVCPGWVKTEMDVADQAAGGYVDSDITGQVPMGRFAAPGDVAAAVVFLADPVRSAFVNGVALPVDGGWTADASWTSLRLSKRPG